MTKYLRMLVAWVSRAHSAIMALNDSFETNFSDKELHFLVIGAMGLVLIMLVYPLFKWLSNRNRVLAITWIYALTVLLVLTFAIEIGQRITGTGAMEFGDIVAGMGGFFAVTVVISALHFIAIATLADAYPQTASKKIGYITSMFATGALISPLVVGFYLGLGFDWRTLFGILVVGSALALFGILKSGTEQREAGTAQTEEARGTGRLILLGVLLLCVVMCIYVGFENGFAYFVDTLFTDVLQANTGKLALSVFWAVMIPARILVGHYAQHAYKILLGCVIAIPVTTLLVAVSNSAPIVLALVVPLGMASGAVYPSVLNLMLPFAGRQTATATAMITTSTGIGGMVFTALTGLMADQWGMRVAMAVLAGFFVLSILAVLWLPRVKTDRS